MEVEFGVKENADGTFVAFINIITTVISDGDVFERVECRESNKFKTFRDAEAHNLRVKTELDNIDKGSPYDA